MILTEQFGKSCAVVPPTIATAIAPAKTTPPIKRILSPVRSPWLVGRFEQGDYFIQAIPLSLNTLDHRSISLR